MPLAAPVWRANAHRIDDTRHSTGERRLLPALYNEHLFLARAGRREVDQRAVVVGASMARMLTERDDARVHLKADLLLESGVVEGADSPAGRGAEGSQQPRASRPRRTHRRNKSRCRFLHESTPYAWDSAEKMHSDRIAPVYSKLTSLLRFVRGESCHSGAATTWGDGHRRV